MRSHCALCGWASPACFTREEAGCRATWHVYEEHRAKWEQMFGTRPPTDPDYRRPDEK